MKRRQLLQATGVGLATAVGTGLAPLWGGRSQAQTRPQTRPQAIAQSGDALTIQALGHMSFLFSGSNQRFLVNPYRSIGCTAGNRFPQVTADVVMISSRLLDEGYVEALQGQPRILFEPGVYQLGRVQVQGIRTPHDLLEGRRFGTNVVWRWAQGGLTVLHLGGAAAPISVEQKILMGTPDVVLIPVGGGPKAYNPQQAKQALSILNPKLVIPTQYRTSAADPKACDLVGVDQFLALMSGTPVRRSGTTLTLRSADLPTQGFAIQVMG